jgi:hypothetical protein
MKKIYVNTEILNEAVSYLNNEITFFGFLSHTKSFLKKLLTSPLNADLDSYLKDNGIERSEFINELIKFNIIEKESKLEEVNGKDMFKVSYKVPKRNFERKMRRLYISKFEKNEVNENININEDGATSCGSAMQGGGLNPDSGQYTTPLGKVQRRKIYVTNEQYEMLKEIGTQDVGNYQYDVPMNFNNGNDPAYDHNNMIAKSFQNKKKGVRNKVKQ